MDASQPYAGTLVSRGRIVPLISSYVSGPLGLLHLPRLWLKALLHASDLLAEDWGCGPGGLDKRIMEFVGIDATAFIPWLTHELPDYAACEAWVSANARNLTPDTIAQSNEKLRTHGLPRDLGPQFRTYLGLDASIEVGIMLNNYDDWNTLHQYVHRYEYEPEAIVPAISPTTTGALGIPQLPRQWCKDLLAAAGALPRGYPLVNEPADHAVLSALGIEPGQARAYVARERPTYVAYERWVRDRAHVSTIPPLDAAEIDAAHAIDWAMLRERVRREGAAPERTGNGILAFSASGRLR